MLSHRSQWSSAMAVLAVTEHSPQTVILHAAPMFHLADCSATISGRSPATPTGSILHAGRRVGGDRALSRHQSSARASDGQHADLAPEDHGGRRFLGALAGLWRLGHPGGGAAARHRRVPKLPLPASLWSHRAVADRDDPRPRISRARRAECGEADLGRTRGPPATEIMIVDPSGAEVPHGTVGSGFAAFPAPF
jgi:hypothetical protein